MATITDKKVDVWLKKFKRKLMLRYNPEKIILFGSRAKKDHLVESDIDLVIVSEKFENIKWPRRLSEVAELWEGLITIEPLCYTPKEFKEKQKQIGILQQALKEGVEL